MGAAVAPQIDQTLAMAVTRDLGQCRDRCQIKTENYSNHML